MRQAHAGTSANIDIVKFDSKQQLFVWVATEANGTAGINLIVALEI